MKYDVIIIGGGPCGLLCAKKLSENGVNTLLLQRSRENESQSFFSTVIFQDSVRSILGEDINFLEFSYERTLNKRKSYVLSQDSFSSSDMDLKIKNSFIFNRKSFINLLKEHIALKNLKIIYETVGRNLIVEKNKVIGVQCDDESFYSDIIINTEGCKSVLNKFSGLIKGDLNIDETYLFIEEVIELPSKIIEERLEIEKNTGIKITLYPENYFNFKSIGYILSNKKSISIVVGVLFSDLVKSGVNINFCMEGIKVHPAIKDLIKGGATIKYLSYIMPKPRVPFVYDKKNKLSGNGYLLVGGSGQLVNFLDEDILDLPMKSVNAACQAILTGDYSLYENILLKELSGVLHVTN